MPLLRFMDSEGQIYETSYIISTTSETNIDATSDTGFFTNSATYVASSGEWNPNIDFNAISAPTFTRYTQYDDCPVNGGVYEDDEFDEKEIPPI